MNRAQKAKYLGVLLSDDDKDAIELNNMINVLLRRNSPGVEVTIPCYK